MKILNIAAGKKSLTHLPELRFLVNLDKCYYYTSSEQHVELQSHLYDQREKTESQEYHIKTDAFEFMERGKILFDVIMSYRFLEHVPKDKVLYFIYLMSSCLKYNGEVDIVVPDYQKLASMIINEKVGEKNGELEWEAHDILLTTEIVNETSDPHASIWTRDRLKYFFELEGRFKTINIQSDYEYDGRDIYIRYMGKKVK